MEKQKSCVYDPNEIQDFVDSVGVNLIQTQLGIGSNKELFYKNFDKI